MKRKDFDNLKELFLDDIRGADVERPLTVRARNMVEQMRSNLELFVNETFQAYEDEFGVED